ncbi:MAG: PilZ domain-containing protein [Blastocatellia bacterium]|nr:PilZ domain-containing protein [Blastocatellia bacterium]
MTPQFEEKRFALRMALRLPIVVSGQTGDGATWSEPTETDDISTLGALFQLNQKIAPGESLYIRSHRPDGVPVEVKAQAVRLTPASYGSTRVGVSIVEQKESWMRLFVAWVADDNVVDGIHE